MRFRRSEEYSAGRGARTGSIGTLENVCGPMKNTILSCINESNKIYHSAQKLQDEF